MEQEYDAAAFKAFEEGGWGTVAATYHDFASGVTVGAIEPILEAVAAAPGKRLLDVACGPGYGAGVAAAKGIEAVGVDFCQEMIDQAVERYPGVAFQLGDAEALPFEDASFDAVICNFGFLHFGDTDKAIGEAFRVLRSGGRYAFTVWMTPDRVEFFSLVTGPVFALGNLDVGVPAGPPPFRFADPEESANALTAAGFSEPGFEELPLRGEFSPEAVVNSLYTAAVRSRALMEAQEPDVRERIHQAILENISDKEQDGIVTLSMPAAMSIGCKP
jgi:SAM-dependent methyltransferase